MAMFNQRKSFLKGRLFYIVLFALFAFGIWVNQGAIIKEIPDNIKAGTDYPVTTKNAVEQGDNGDYDIMENIVGKNQAVTPGGVADNETVTDTGITTANKGYYLVKEVNGIIKVFHYDKDGKESLIRDTDIAFSLLSIADQALFKKGVIKQTQEELNELLQDFES